AKTRRTQRGISMEDAGRPAGWDEALARAFARPLKLHALLAGFERPWFLAGGWALDLFLGQVTRAHHDLEFVVFREDQRALRRYRAKWEFIKFRPGDESRMEWWEEEEWLAPSFVQVYAQREGHDPVAFEVFLQESAGDRWWFHKDPAIARP